MKLSHLFACWIHYWVVLVFCHENPDEMNEVNLKQILIEDEQQTVE